MRVVCGFFLLAALWIPATEALPDNPDKVLTVVEGRSVTFDAPIPIGNTANSNPKVVEAVVDRQTNQVVFLARKAGSATYTLWNRKSAKQRFTVLIKVDKRDFETDAATLREIFREIDGVVVRVVADQIIVDGTVVLPEELLVIDRVLAKYPDAVNLVGLDATVLLTIAKAIEDEIARPTVRTKVVGDTILLEGYVYSEAEKERAENIAHAMLPRANTSIKVK